MKKPTWASDHNHQVAMYQHYEGFVNDYICNVACIHTSFPAQRSLHNWTTSVEMHQEKENNSEAENT